MELSLSVCSVGGRVRKAVGMDDISRERGSAREGCGQDRAAVGISLRPGCFMATMMTLCLVGLPGNVVERLVTKGLGDVSRRLIIQRHNGFSVP